MEVSMSKTRRGKYTDNRICYISKCKGDMRLYLRRKDKLPCFSYLVRGKSFSFYRGKIKFLVHLDKLIKFLAKLVGEFRCNGVEALVQQFPLLACLVNQNI